MISTRMAAIILTSLVIAGCAAPAQVTKIGPDTYALNVGAMGIEGGEAGARNKALAKASEYCASLGRHFNLTNMDSKGPVEWGSAAGSASISFRCDQ